MGVIHRSQDLIATDQINAYQQKLPPRAVQQGHGDPARCAAASVRSVL
jgi:hypothetical protein